MNSHHTSERLDIQETPLIGYRRQGKGAGPGDHRFQPAQESEEKERKRIRDRHPPNREERVETPFETANTKPRLQVRKFCS